MKTTTTTVVCGKCNGKGKLSWTQIADGVCFVCNGAGRLEVETADVEALKMPRAVCIANLARALKEAEASDASEDMANIGRLLAHADADVKARALAAIARFDSNSSHTSWLLAREEALEVEALVARVRKAIKAVRKIA